MKLAAFPQRRARLGTSDKDGNRVYAEWLLVERRGS